MRTGVWSDESSKQDLAEICVGGNAFGDAEVNQSRELVSVSGPICGFSRGEMLVVESF
jgi:hypothetical protein